MSLTENIASGPTIARDATVLVDAAIEASITGGEDRLGECVHAMLAHPVRAALYMWTLVHTGQALLDAVAGSQCTSPAEALAKLAPTVADVKQARAAAALAPQTAGSVGGR